MPNERTYNEWIEDNNDKIDEIKAIAQNLPEYQDIEPIYGDADYSYINSFKKLSITSYINNFFTYQDSHEVGLYKINSDNTVTRISYSYSQYYNPRFLYTCRCY